MQSEEAKILSRRGLFIGLAALLIVGADSDSEARKRRRKRGTRRRKSSSFSSFSSQRGTTSGSCPCNGGDVCVGPRGGRYCITSGGNKRYGV